MSFNQWKQNRKWPSVEIVATIDEHGGMAEAGNSLKFWGDPAIEVPNRSIMRYAPKGIATVTFNSMLDAAQPLYESERNLVIGSPEEAPSVGRHFDHMLVPSIPRAIELVGRESAYRFFLIGDALFHEDAIQYADRIHLTTVEGTHHTAEFFPDFDDGFETDPTVIPRAGESNGVKFINQSYRRK